MDNGRGRRRTLFGEHGYPGAGRGGDDDDNHGGGSNGIVSARELFKAAGMESKVVDHPCQFT